MTGLGLMAPMSALTIFLGKLIGAYCLIVGLTMMTNRQTMVDAVNALIRSPPLVLLAGVFAVAVGLGLVWPQRLVRRRAAGRRHPCWAGIAHQRLCTFGPST